MSMEEKRDEALNDISKLIIWAFRGSKTKQDIAIDLESLGFPRRKIATLLNTPSKDISSILIRKNKKTKSKK